MSLHYLTVGQWRRRPARALLTIFSVAIAVTAVLGTALSQSTVRRAFKQMSQSVEGPPALEIVATAGGRFDASTLPNTADLAGVKRMTPLVCQGVKARAHSHRLRTLVVGLDDKADSRVWEQLDVTAGRPACAANEVVVAESVAQSLEAELGTRVLFLTRRGWRTATVVGLAETRSLRDLSPGATMALPAETLQKWNGIEREVDRARVLLVEGANRKGVKAAIEEILPSELTVQMPVGQMVVAESMLRQPELALQFAGVLSLAMAAFIILNTLRMNFSERRRQLATLRALGATQSQISSLLVTEGLWIGLLGSGLGIPGGLGLAYFLGKAMQGLLQVEQLPTVLPGWETMLLAVASGPIVSVLAAYLPALQARRISPIEQMSEVETPQGDLFRSLSLIAAPVAGGLAVILLLLVIAESIPPWAGIPAFVLLLLAFISLLPLVVRPLVRVGNWMLSWLWGIEGRLASEQLMRRPTRTGLTAGVLVIALTSGLGLGNAILNNVEDVQAWYRRFLAGDFFLTNPNVGDDSTLTEDNASGDLTSVLKGTPGVDQVITLRLPAVRIMNSPAKCFIQDFPSEVGLPWTTEPQETAEIRAGLAAGELVVASVLAHELGVVAGDTVRLELRGRTMSLRIAAIVNDYNQGGMVAFLDRGSAEQAFNLGPVEFYMVVRKQDAELGELEGALRSLAEQHGLILQSFANLRRQFDQLINGIVVSLWTLLVLGFVVGGFAVANTLTMSVLEQTREFGLLRIVGMTRGQVRKMVLSEAALLGSVGLLMGTLSGISTAFLIHACASALTSHQVPFEFHAWLLAANAGGCLLVSVLSAWIPCRRAMRLNLLNAIAYE